MSVDAVVRANVERVRREIAAACARTGRHVNEVTLIGVTKSVARPVADALIAAGVRDIGENRVQDAVAKFGPRSGSPSLDEGVRLHMIGNLQTNKVRDVVGLFSSVQSLNRTGLADALQREAVRRGLSVDVLIEVNLSGETSKQGANVGDIGELLGYVLRQCSAVHVRGLMTIAPNVSDMEGSRLAFRALRELRDGLRISWPDTSLDILSMGMSNDYPVAIEEGATHIRIGRALFVGLPSPG